ncbi:hypothetical protein VTN96DRAFT_2741 [Rasamsonia emersonii]
MFGRNPSSSHRYDPLPAAESGDNKEEPAQQSDEAAALPRRRFPLFWTLYFVFMHCVILLLLLGLLLLLWSTSRGQKGQNAYSLLASELPFARDSTRYLETVFSPSGFSDSSQQPSAYYGEPTPEKDRLWKSLYDVGMVVITKEEYEQLDVETTTLVGDEDHYLVTLEVFHQLHCLDYLRNTIYPLLSGAKTHHPDESEWVKKTHIDHCIDYLRQVLQCHGDLTPITLETIPGVPVLPPPNPAPYKPNFSIRHTCRDFDAVYDFALKRNSSGYKVA